MDFQQEILAKSLLKLHLGTRFYLLFSNLQRDFWQRNEQISQNLPPK